MISTRESAKRLSLTAALLALLCSACASTGDGMWDSAGSRRQAERLQQRLTAAPDDADALRDLGVLYLRAKRYDQGYEFLQRAIARKKDDPAALFHLGLAAELVGRRDTALMLYRRYTEVPARSSYRKQLEGRFLWLQRLKLRDELRSKLQEEAGGERVDVSPSVVAVFPFRFLGEDERYQALGRGMAEMLTIDLANVNALQVVERVRLQALLDELELAQSGMVDDATAPRAGRLLGAGRVVGGNYDVPDRRTLTVDAGMMQLSDSPAFAFDSDVQTAAINDLFRLEKELAFRLIDEMGVTLTAEEQARIEVVPTQNLQAFLAYSRGLGLEDAGNFKGAAGSYGQAGRLDPSFQVAQAKASSMEGLASVSGTAEEVLENTILASGEVDLVGSRIGSLNNTLGAAVVPGQDTRKPVQETPDLPSPPPPRPAIETLVPHSPPKSSCAMRARILLLLMLPAWEAFAQPGGLYLGSQQRPVQISVSGLYQRYADDAGYVSQASFPLSVFVPVGRSLAVGLLTAPAVAEGTGLTSLGGAADVQMALSYHRSIGAGSVVASLTANLPSGRDALGTEESGTALVLSRSYYDFRVPTLGQGLSISPGITLAFPVGEKLALGVGAAYQYRGGFEPYADLESAYEPGDEITLTGGADVRLGATSRASADASYSLYQTDRFGDEEVYTPGNKIVLTAQFIQPLGSNEFRFLGRYRSRAGTTFPGVDESGEAGVLRTLPNQVEARGALTTGFTDRAGATWLVQARQFGETADLESKLLFDVGAMPRVAISETLTLTTHLMYTFGDLSGLEAGLGMSVTL